MEVPTRMLLKIFFLSRDGNGQKEKENFSSGAEENSESNESEIRIFNYIFMAKNIRTIYNYNDVNVSGS